MKVDAPSPTGSGSRLAALVTGLLMAGAYFRLHETVVFRMEMGKSFLLINTRESLFWLSHYLLLVPGLLLVAWAIAPRLARLARARRLRSGGQNSGRSRPGREIRLSTGARRILWAAGFGLCLLFVSWLGRSLFLLDLPITNDEYTILFGAKIVLEGAVTAPDIPAEYGFSMPWIYRGDSRIASMDFPGTILLTALAIWSGLEKWLFFLLSALSGVALVAACGRLDGRRGLWMGAVLWLVSPMATTLSFTLHSHLVSRSFVALAYALWIWTVTREDGEAPWWAGAGLGFCAAAAFVSRPAEAATVLLPVGLHLLWRAWNGQQAAKVTAMAAGLTGLTGPLLTAWWNAATTGAWNVSARVLMNTSIGEPLWPAVWHRLGENLGFNLMMLLLWFLGPLVAALVIAALRSSAPIARWVAQVCAAGVACQLLMALLHDSTGIRIVGPIHYSEAAVPLLILSVLGLRRLVQLLDRFQISLETPTALLGAYLLSLVIWTGVHTGSLVDQAVIHRLPLDATAHLENAIVISDRPSDLWFSRPELEDVSSWLADLPHPDPFLRNEVIFAYPEADVELLRRDFPDRKLYRMTFHGEGEAVRLRPLEP